MNYFESKSAAERYAKGRPYFQFQVIEKVKSYVKPNNLFNKTIDMGCRTGLSTIALKNIAHKIVGVDSSAEMIALVLKNSKIEYSVAHAECIPVSDHDFNCMTLCSVFHWIQQEIIFAEANRILFAESWIIICNNYFFAQMIENEVFQSWYQEEYLHKYPSPPGNLAARNIEEFNIDDISLIHKEEYENKVRCSIEPLIDYLVMQSNIIVAVENGKQSIIEIKKWLFKEITPFFDNKAEATFLFGGCRRSSVARSRDKCDSPVVAGAGEFANDPACARWFVGLCFSLLFEKYRLLADHPLPERR